MAMAKTKLTPAQKRIRRAVKRAVEGNADDLHEMLKHENSAFGSVYEAISDAYDKIEPDEPLDSEQAEEILGLLQDALGSMREMVIDAERED